MGIEQEKPYGEPEIKGLNPEAQLDMLLRAENRLDFLREICQEMPLRFSHEEIKRLKLEGKTTELVYFCLPTLCSVIDRHSGLGLSESELFNRGCFGLHEAIESWNPEKETPSGKPNYLKMYASNKISRILQKSIVQRHGLRSTHEFSLVILYQQCLQNFIEENDRPPSLEEISSLVEEENGDNLRLYSGPKKQRVSKVAIIYYATQQEALSQATNKILTPPLEEIVDRDSLKTTLVNLVDGLPKKESEVIRLCYGFPDGDSRSLTNVGKILGVTGQAASNRLNNAIRDLRQLRRIRKIQAFRDESQIKKP